MIRCMVIKLEDVFEDRGEIKEILFEGKLSKDAYGYIKSALKDSCDNHVSVAPCCQKWVACLCHLIRQVIYSRSTIASML